MRQVSVLLALGLLLFSLEASAQSASDLYNQGLQALSAGRYADAAQALDASYRKQPTPVVLYNLGLAYKGLNHPDRALEAFEGYVKYADPKKDQKTITAVRAEIDRIKGAFARFTLKLTPPNAAIDIDGSAADTSKNELWVTTGKHKISVHADGYENYEQALEVAAGRFDLEVHLREASGPPEARAAALVDEGIALQAAGNVDAAIAKFKSAEAIYPNARGEAQLGLCEEGVNDLPSAEAHIEAALKSPKDPFVRENKRKLKAARDRIKGQLATLTIKGTPDGAEVFVNGKSVGVLPIYVPVRVAAGSLTVSAKKQGYADYEQVLELPRRGQRTIRITMDQAPPVVAAPVPVPTPAPAPTPPVAAATPALTEQPPIAPLPEETPKPTAEAPTQADIEAASEPQPAQEPEPLGPRPTATGFEMAVNFGYQPWLGAKTDGSSGLLSPQLLFGARLLWPLSFGLALNGGFDLGTSGTSFVSGFNPGLYVRAHTLHYREPLSFDGWAGAGFQPVAIQVTALKADKNANTNVDPNSVAPNSKQAQALNQAVGFDRVHTLQSLNIPFELGGTFFVTDSVGFDLGVGLTLWLPQQSCLHNGSDRLCTGSGLKTQTSLFMGGGVTLLP